MKKLLIYALALGTLSSCEKIDEFTQFEMPFTETFVIQANTPLDLPLSLSTPDIETDYQAIYEQYNTGRERIEEIQLREVTFTVKSPDGADFDFLESISLSMSNEDKPETEIAFKSQVEDGLTKLELETTDDNLKDYVSVDQFRLLLNTVTDQTLAEDIELEVRTAFFVDAKVLGQ